VQDVERQYTCHIQHYNDDRIGIECCKCSVLQLPVYCKKKLFTCAFASLCADVVILRLCFVSKISDY